MLRDAGLNKTAVARRLKLHRQTVTKYWDGSVDEMTPPRYKARLTKVDSYREYITSRLEEYPELHAEALFHEIKTMGYDGSARTVRRFVAKIRPQKVREYKPVDALPGEQAQVDWGHVGTHVVNGVRRKLYVFVMTLSWSRAMYFEFVTSLNMATFAGSLHRALAFFKGVPKEVVFDNAKTVVADRVGDAVQFNSDLLHLALHYGFTPRACWIHDPESKGKVESNVKYVKKSFFYGRKFDGVNELNAQAQQWIEAVAHRRVHGTTFKHPGEELEKERPYMSPFVAGSGPSGIVEQRSVSKDGLISVERNFYSVPSHLARRRINIRRFENRFEVLDDGRVVAEHKLLPGKGGRRIVEEHYPHASRQRRSRGLQMQFETLCPEAAEYLQGLSRSTTRPLREQVHAILALREDYTTAAFSAAMRRALEFGQFGYRSLKRILELQEKAPNSLPQISVPPMLHAGTPGAGTLQRDPSYYSGVGR